MRIEVSKPNLGTDDTSQLAVGDQTTMLQLLAPYPLSPRQFFQHWTTLISYLAYEISLCGHFDLRSCSLGLRPRPHEPRAVVRIDLALKAGEVVLPLTDGASELLATSSLSLLEPAKPGDHAGYLR